MKHLWYCLKCSGVFFMPWLDNQNIRMGDNVMIKEIEQECKVCKSRELFRMIRE